MSTVLKNEQKKVSMFSNMLMILTSIHHVYGSIIYKTPWRAHVLFLSIPVIVITVILSRFIQRMENVSRKFLFWINWAIILLASVLLIGLFEGLYNHVLKNILFFSGLSVVYLSRLFPTGMYEMPDDLIFEATGVIQGIIAVLLILHFVKLTRYIIKSTHQFA